MSTSKAPKQITINKGHYFLMIGNEFSGYYMTEEGAMAGYKSRSYNRSSPGRIYKGELVAVIAYKTEVQRKKLTK